MAYKGRRTGLKSRDFIESQDAVGIYEFARATGYSYKHVYEQVRLGNLQARFEQGLWLIPRAVLEAALTQLTPNSNTSDT